MAHVLANECGIWMAVFWNGRDRLYIRITCLKNCVAKKYHVDLQIGWKAEIGFTFCRLDLTTSFKINVNISFTEWEKILWSPYCNAIFSIKDIHRTLINKVPKLKQTWTWNTWRWESVCLLNIFMTWEHLIFTPSCGQDKERQNLMKNNCISNS